MKGKWALALCAVSLCDIAPEFAFDARTLIPFLPET